MQKILQLFLIFYLFSLQLSGQTDNLNQLVSINMSSVDPDEILTEITNQTKINFSFNPRIFDEIGKLSFHVANATAISAIEQFCQQTFITHLVVEGQIVLTRLSKDQLPTYTLSGYLADHSSGEDLINATVSIDSTSYGTYTNEFGYFVLSLKRGRHRIVFSYVGFEEKVMEFNVTRNISQRVSLQLASADLPTVVINPNRFDIMDEKQLGQLQLSNEDLSKLPELGSESDLVKGLESLPGVKRHSDLSSFYYVRGGDRDQNVIIIDDAPIYNPSHLLGIASMVLPDFAKSIDVYKSDIPTSMGDRLASIVSIRTKDGNLNKFQLSGAFNPLVNRISAEIPVIKQRSSIFVSYRRSAFELYNRDPNNDNTFFFQDFHIKWNYKPNQKNRFFITMIQSADEYSGYVGELSNIKSGNFAATLRWNRTLGAKLFTNTTLYTGNYSYVSRFTPNVWQSALGTLSLKSDFTHFASNTYHAKFGIEVQGYFNSPGGITRDSSNTLLPAVTRNYHRKLVVYYQGQFDISEKLRVNAGLRAINWENIGPMTYHRFDENYNLQQTLTAPEGTYNSYFNVDPRLSIQYKLSSTSQLKASYGIYHQYLQLISNSISPFTAMEVWLTASPHIKPQSAEQWELGLIKRFKKTNLEFSTSVYYKKSKNQIDFNGHSTIYLNPLLEGELRFGTANSYGVELLLKKDIGRLKSSLAYTYSRVKKKTDGLNNDETYRAFQDRPHDLAITFQYDVSDRFFCSAYWTSYSGSTFTSPIGFYTFNGKTVPIYGERNNDRLPTYHRLDVSCNYRLNKDLSKRFQHNLTFSIYNAIGRRNLYGVKFNKLGSDELNPDVPTNILSNNPLSASHLELTQFFPSLTYKFSL